MVKRQLRFGKDVRRYPTFSEMLEHEEAERIVPGMPKEEILNWNTQSLPKGKLTNFSNLLTKHQNFRLED